MAWGDIYLAASEASEKWKAQLVVKLKSRNGTLNGKEIRFIADVYHIQAKPRPDNPAKARIIKALNGEDIAVRQPGNPGTARDKERDIALTEAFAAFKGSRADFYRMQQVKAADYRNIDRALLRGESYIKEETNRLKEETDRLKEEIDRLEGYQALLQVLKTK